MQTSHLWRRLVIHSAPALSAEFSAPRMAARPGTKSFTKMKTPAALTWLSILQIPTSSLLLFGRRDAHPGEWTAAAPGAVCIVPLMAAAIGNVSPVMACLMEFLDASLWPWLMAIPTESGRSLKLTRVDCFALTMAEKTGPWS